MSSRPPNHMSEESCFLLDSVSIRFPGAERAVLENVSLTIRRHEFLSIVGPSGCGKSTLLKIFSGLLAPSSGEIVGSPSHGRPGKRVGFVFQHPTLLPWRTARENLALPAELGTSRTVTPVSEDECQALLKQVGLSPGDAGKRPAELSGGMQMRLSLARALATQPDVLLLDEPFAAVDDLLRIRLQEDVRRIHEDRGLTTILVTHNVPEAVFLSDRVIVLNGTPARVASDIPVPSSMPRSSSFRDAEAAAIGIRKINAALFHSPLMTDGNVV